MDPPIRLVLALLLTLGLGGCVEETDRYPESGVGGEASAGARYMQRLVLYGDAWQPPTGLWFPTLGGGLVFADSFEGRLSWGMDVSMAEAPRLVECPDAADGKTVLEIAGGSHARLYPETLAAGRTYRVTVMARTPGAPFNGEARAVFKSEGNTLENPVGQLTAMRLRPEGTAAGWTRLGGWFKFDSGSPGLLLRAAKGELAQFDAVRIADAATYGVPERELAESEATRLRQTLQGDDNRWVVPLWSNDSQEFLLHVPSDRPHLKMALAYVTPRSQGVKSAERGQPVRVRLSIRDDFGTHAIDSLEIAAKRSAQEATWLEHKWTLDRWAGRSVLLSVHCSPTDAHCDPDGVVLLGAPRVLSQVPQPRPQNLIIVSLDTLRADRLGVYGYERATSPNIDALAKRGVVVERAYSSSAYTLPGHASLFTGQYSSTHGTLDGKTPITARVSPMLAEILARRGYGTLAVTAGGFVQPEFGFGRGFDHYTVRESLVPSSPTETMTDGLSRALDRVSEVSDLPFFLFLHTYGIHDFSPLPEDLEPFRNTDGENERLYRDTRRETLTDQANDYRNATPEQVKMLSDLYDGTIRGVDRVIGLVSDLEKRGLLDNTLLVITSDHGEEFYEHEGLYHGHSLYEEVIRVPMIWIGPDLPAGERVVGPMSLVDVTPTVLRLLGIDGGEARDRMEGRDLSQHLIGKGVPAPFVLTELAWKRFYAATYSDGTQKAMRRLFKRGKHESTEYELYDLERDPSESEDLSPEFPRRMKDWAAQLQALQTQARERRRSFAGSDFEAPTLPGRVLDALRDLGYFNVEDQDR